MATESVMKAEGKFSHRGVSFKFNEVVNIVSGTAAGVPEKNTEAMRAWFKSEDKGYFICKPVIGGGRGPLLRFDKDTVYKLKSNTFLLRPNPYLFPFAVEHNPYPYSL